MRKQLEVRMNALSRDVAKINKLYENALDKISKLDGRVRELTKVEGELALVRTALEDSEYNNDVKTQQLAELKEESTQAKVDLAAANNTIFDQSGHITQLNYSMAKLQTELEVTQHKVDTLTDSLAKMTASKEHFEVSCCSFQWFHVVSYGWHFLHRPNIIYWLPKRRSASATR